MKNRGPRSGAARHFPPSRLTVGYFRCRDLIGLIKHRNPNLFKSMLYSKTPAPEADDPSFYRAAAIVLVT
jgi:hypothetical protein